MKAAGADENEADVAGAYIREYLGVEAAGVAWADAEGPEYKNGSRRTGAKRSRITLDRIRMTLYLTRRS